MLSAWHKGFTEAIKPGRSRIDPMSEYLNLYFWMQSCLNAIRAEKKRMAQNPYSSWHAADWRWAKTELTVIFLSRFYLLLAHRAA